MKTRGRAIPLARAGEAVRRFLVSVLVGAGSSFGLWTEASGQDFNPKTDFATGINPFSVAIGDFNGDGHPDLAVANVNGSTVSILLGTGGGAFAPKSDIVLGGSPQYIASGDMNGDGKPDLVVANSAPAFHSAEVLLGNGDGTFGPKTDYGAGNRPRAVALADVNQDGNLDVLVADQGASSVSRLLGNGDGTLRPYNSYGTEIGPASVAIGDLNGDGKLDLALPDLGANKVSVLLGHGDGTFAAKVDYPTAGGPVFVAIADFDADGKLDLAVANNGPGTFSVLRGNGDGTFAPRTDFAVGAGPIALDVGDLNHDTRLDVVVANNTSNTISVLPGNGDGTFGPRTNLGTGSSPASVVIADLNSDGNPDLAVTNLGSNTVSVLLYDAMPPTVPAPFTGVFSGAPVQLHWGANTEPDFAAYNLYRGSAPDFVPGPTNLVSSQPDTGYTDTQSTWSYYKLSARDRNGNESGFALVTPVGQYSTPTPAGANVPVSLASNVQLTFQDVSSAGESQLVLQTGGTPPPSGLHLVPSSPALYYELSTTATFDGSVLVCVTYDPAQVAGPESDLKLMHMDTTLDPPAWVDATTLLDTTANVLCGTVTHFSEFAVMKSDPVSSVGAAIPGFRLFQCVPNPVLARAQVVFEIPEVSPTRFRLFDLQGRMVRELERGSLRSAGRHTVDWDGRDDHGERVQPGIYFLSLEAGRLHALQRIVVLRR